MYRRYREFDMYSDYGTLEVHDFYGQFRGYIRIDKEDKDYKVVSLKPLFVPVSVELVDQPVSPSARFIHHNPFYMVPKVECCPVPRTYKCCGCVCPTDGMMMMKRRPPSNSSCDEFENAPPQLRQYYIDNIWVLHGCICTRSRVKPPYQRRLPTHIAIDKLYEDICINHILT